MLEQIVESVVGGTRGYAQQPSRLALDVANYFTGYRLWNHPSKAKGFSPNAWRAAVTLTEIIFFLLEPGEIPYIVAAGEAVRPSGMAIFKVHDYVTDRICGAVKEGLSHHKRSGEKE